VLQSTITSNHPLPPPLSAAMVWTPRAVSTPRMTLRPLEPSDRPTFLAALSASLDHLAPWMPAPADWGIDAGLDAHFEQSLDRAARAHASGSAVRLFAFDSAGTLLGSFNLNNIVRGVGQMADAGWWVAAPALGRGLATEGVSALLSLAFAPHPLGLGLHRVAAGIIPRNARSIRVAEKCGMRREGLALRLVKIAGTWEDHWVYAKTAEEHPG